MFNLLARTDVRFALNEKGAITEALFAQAIELVGVGRVFSADYKRRVERTSESFA